MRWFNLGSSVGVLEKLLSNSPFVTKVTLVALKSILYKYYYIKLASIYM